jgi:hypothetical protein
MKKFLVPLVIVLLSATVAVADTIYLRDGRTIQGTLIGFINGRFAVRVSGARTNANPNANANPNVNPNVNSNVNQSTVIYREGEIVFFRPSEVDKIEIEGRSLDDLRFETKTVEVALSQGWVDSGLDLKRNERVRISATGTILAGRSRITPDGLRTTDPNAPLPRAAEGLLIGAIGEDSNAPIIELGSSKEFTADRDGRLYLTSNRGSFNDTRGAFMVEIKRERDMTATQGGEDVFGGRRGRGRGRGRANDTQSNQPQEITVSVPGTSRATDTNIDVRAGAQLSFTASGQIVAGRRIGQVGPEGGRTSGFGSVIGTRPVPSAGPGALIGYIRTTDGQTSQPFLVGSQTTITVPADGRLFLAINDDDYSDNGGSFSVKIVYR